jgi:hypothetical protein
MIELVDGSIQSVYSVEREGEGVLVELRWGGFPSSVPGSTASTPNGLLSVLHRHPPDSRPVLWPR